MRVEFNRNQSVSRAMKKGAEYPARNVLMSEIASSSTLLHTGTLRPECVRRRIVVRGTNHNHDASASDRRSHKNLVCDFDLLRGGMK